MAPFGAIIFCLPPLAGRNPFAGSRAGRAAGVCLDPLWQFVDVENAKPSGSQDLRSMVEFPVMQLLHAH